MAKTQNTRPVNAARPPQLPVAEPPMPRAEAQPNTIYDFKVQAVIVGLLALIFYFNSFFNEVAHDDGIVIVKNEYVQEGIKGIPKIFTKDAYDSYYRLLNTTNQLSGGRYRPLSIATFAIEQSFMGAMPEEALDSVMRQNITYGVRGDQEQKLIRQMHVRHAINVLWYALSVIVVLWFLRFIVFRNNLLIALTAAILFTIHPIHTEVVANVKSRDEIMSLLFMCLTFIFAFKYEENKNNFTLPVTSIENFFKKFGFLIAGLLSFLLAFLSKEYAVTMVVLLPLAFYIFNNYSWKRSILTIVPYLPVVLLYIAIRLNVIYFGNPAQDFEVLNPFILKHLPGMANSIESINKPVISYFPLLILAGSAFAVFRYTQTYYQEKSESGIFKNVLLSLLPFVILSGIYLLVLMAAVPGSNANSDNEVLNNPYLFTVGHQKLATEIATSLNYLKLLIFPHPLSADYSYDSIPYRDFTSDLVWLSLLVHAALVVAMVFTFRKRNLLCFAIAFYLLHLAMVCNIFFDIGATMGERLIYHSSLGFAIAAAWLIWKGFERLMPAESVQKAMIGLMSVIILLAGYVTIPRNADWKNDGTLFEADLKVVPNSVLVCANVAASYITKADEVKTDTEKHAYLYKAIALLDHALNIHPNMVASYINRGIGWYKLGDMDKAKANLDSAKRRYPNYPTLPGIYKLIGEDYMNKGWSKYGKNGMYPEAVAEFKKGIEIDSANADLWYNLGGAYYSNHQFAEAVDAWKVALKLRPNYEKAQRGMQAAIANMNAMSGQQPKK